MNVTLVLNVLEGFEGFRSRPYLDTSGVPTIGYGSTFYKDGTRVTMSDPPISREAALELKKYVVNEFWRDMQSLIRVNLNDNQKAALISLAYNIGVSAFAGSTVLRLVNANPEDPTIRGAFEMWRYSDGRPVLLGRRQKEADLYFKKKVVADPSCCCPCHS